MKIKNDQAGLTLVELLVTILVASIVTLAATTVLLLGLRINNQSTKTAMGQNTVQVLMEALEDVAAEAENLVVENDGEDWMLYDRGEKETDTSNDTVFFSYSYDSKTVNSGTDSTFLSGVLESYVTLSTNGLLTIDVVTEQGNYSTSVYCRMVKDGDTTAMDIIDKLNNDKVTTDDTNVEKFLKILASQYGSRGEIINPPDSTYKYYSEWYLRGKGGYAGNPSWNKDTPWCACYISWALEHTQSGLMPEFAHVELMAAHFGTLGDSGSVGDLIFFDWDADGIPQHVGAVLSIEGNYIYTIEGNTAGKVAVRKYAVGDTRIMGYGVLNWT